MAIPEHNKCVAVHKRLRYEKQKGNWRKVREIRRKNGEIKPKIRIRAMINVEYAMEKSRISKRFGLKYWESNIVVYGPYYRKWGKYDD